MTVSGLNGLVWRKSSRSGAGNDCVEIALGEDGTVMRDSKNPQGDVLFVELTAWASFLRATTQRVR